MNEEMKPKIESAALVFSCCNCCSVGVNERRLLTLATQRVLRVESFPVGIQSHFRCSDAHGQTKEQLFKKKVSTTRIEI